MSFWLRCDRCPSVAPFDEQTVRETTPFGIPGPPQTRPRFPVAWQTLQIGPKQFHLCPACLREMEAFAGGAKVLDG